MFTEVLISASKFGLITEACSTVRRSLECVETVLICSDITENGFRPALAFSDLRHSAAFSLCRSAVEELHRFHHHPESLANAINRLTLRAERFIAVQQAGSSDPIARSLYCLVEGAVDRALEACARDLSLDVVASSGSYSRAETTFGSDVEVFLIGSRYRDSELHLIREFRSILDMDLDMYVVTDLKEVAIFLSELPDYFVDFANAKPHVRRDSQGWKTFVDNVDGVSRLTNFLAAVLARRTPERLSAAIADNGAASGLLKEILNAWATVQAVARACNEPTVLDSSDKLKRRLLYYKSCFEIERKLGPLCLPDRTRQADDFDVACRLVGDAYLRISEKL